MIILEERYLTVTALTKYIKYKFDHDHHLEDVLLEGEISNFKHNSRGHFYFTLKDATAQISATMFSSSASKVKFEPEDGMKVYVKGSVSVYEPSGTYQINCRSMEVAGIGDLYVAFEKLKKELEELGLFNPALKKPIPKFPKTIGVVTSPTGAAIRDIINTITRRYPLARVILYPAIVQGETAKDDIVRQIKHANADNLCDVLIVGRGGGSIEDLWAFNEKVVAFAIHESNIPIISAVGHEIDFTIADFVADMRAATPTAGAEIATPKLDTLKENILAYQEYMSKRIKYIFDEKRTKLLHVDKLLDSKNPKETLKRKKEALDNLSKDLKNNIINIITAKKHIYDIQKSKLDALNPLMIMEKGYSIPEVDGKIITDIKDVKVNDTLKTKLKNGVIVSKVMEVNDGK